jgi:hypothetical protein
MVIAGLLVIGLISLIVGLVLPNAAWLIASVIASAGAGYLVLRARPVAAAHAGGAPGDASVPGDAGAAGSGGAAAGDERAEPIGPVESAALLGEPAAHTTDVAVRRGEDVARAGEDDVWVIDGRPRYHLATCAIIQGQDAEPVPIDQANEDGFMPCSLCEPDAVRSGERSAAG